MEGVGRDSISYYSLRLGVSGLKKRAEPQYIITMKNTLSILTVLALAAAAHAGCGTIATTEGKLASFDAEKKVLVVTDKSGKDTSITLTPETKGADSVKDLVGKAVKVEASVHAKTKALSVEAGTAAPAEEPKKEKKKKEKKA